MVVIGVSEKQTKRDQVQKRAGRSGVDILGLVPAVFVRKAEKLKNNVKGLT